MGAFLNARIIKCGASAPEECGDTLLTFAARHNAVDFVQLLLKHGADVDARNCVMISDKDLASRTPLQEACAHGAMDVIPILLEAGADVRAQVPIAREGGYPPHKWITPAQEASAQKASARGAVDVIPMPMLLVAGVACADVVRAQVPIAREGGYSPHEWITPAQDVELTPPSRVRVLDMLRAAGADMRGI